MMTSREQFEQKIQHAYGEDYLVVNDDGDYVNWITADLWEFWVASRAGIEIQACPCPNDHGPYVDDHYREQINNAGLKLKK